MLKQTHTQTQSWNQQQPERKKFQCLMESLSWPKSLLMPSHHFIYIYSLHVLDERPPITLPFSLHHFMKAWIHSYGTGSAHVCRLLSKKNRTMEREWNKCQNKKDPTNGNGVSSYRAVLVISPNFLQILVGSLVDNGWNRKLQNQPANRIFSVHPAMQ